MARFVASQIQCLDIIGLNEYVVPHTESTVGLPLAIDPNVTLPTPPPDYIPAHQVTSLQSTFTDIEGIAEEEAIKYLVAQGILPLSTTSFNPSAPLLRIDAMDWLIKAVHFVPTNVYNDHYKDVLGHEWYAGLVEVVTQNQLLPDVLTPDHQFLPDKPTTFEEFITFLLTAYRCRKAPPTTTQLPTYDGISDYAKTSITQALALGLIEPAFIPHAPITRAQAASLLERLCLLL